MTEVKKDYDYITEEKDIFVFFDITFWVDRF